MTLTGSPGCRRGGRWIFENTAADYSAQVHPSTLLPAERRFALFDKRPHAFFLIVGREQRAEHLLFKNQRPFKGQRRTQTHDPLGLAHGEWAFFSDGFRQRQDHRHERIGRTNLVHQTHRHRLRGTNQLARVNELARTPDPDAGLQTLCTTKARHDPQVDLGEAETRLFGSVDKVCTQCEFETTAQGESIDRGDDGDRTGFHRKPKAMGNLGNASRLQGSHLGKRGDVGARRKGLGPRARHDQTTQIGPMRERIHLTPQGDKGRFVKGVQNGGAVHGKDRDGAVVFKQHGVGVGHARDLGLVGG